MAVAAVAVVEVVAMLEIIITLVAVFVLAFAIAKWQDERAQRVHRRLERVRKIVGILIGILLVGTFIQSGRPILVLFSIVILVLTALYLAVDQPHKETI